MNSSSQATLTLRDLGQSFGPLKVLEGVDFELFPGECVALLGPSGSGKSSLLHIAGLLEQPSAGEVIIGAQETSSLTDRERTRLRRNDVGFVYQFHHLLPEFDALGNVTLPQLIAGVGPETAHTRATDLLQRMGLGERLHHQPGQLSGGEQQRTAIARALANQPKLLLADEPTGNLDEDTSAKVFDELLSLIRGSTTGATPSLAALIATHDQALAARMDRVVTIRNHRIVPYNS